MQNKATTEPSVEVREAGTKGRGVFALRDFAPGEVVVIGKPLMRVPEVPGNHYRSTLIPTSK